MQALPHHYRVKAQAQANSSVTLEAQGVSALESNPPPEFGGPEGYWSPESLLVASMADCFILSFRAVSKASKLEWQAISCDVSGKLERVDKVTLFTEFTLDVSIQLSNASDAEQAERLAHKAENICLISNSLSAQKTLRLNISH